MVPRATADCGDTESPDHRARIAPAASLLEGVRAPPPSSSAFACVYKCVQQGRCTNIQLRCGGCVCVCVCVCVYVPSWEQHSNTPTHTGVILILIIRQLPCCLPLLHVGECASTPFPVLFPRLCVCVCACACATKHISLSLYPLWYGKRGPEFKQSHW